MKRVLTLVLALITTLVISAQQPSPRAPEPIDTYEVIFHRCLENPDFEVKIADCRLCPALGICNPSHCSITVGRETYCDWSVLLECTALERPVQVNGVRTYYMCEFRQDAEGRYYCACNWGYRIGRDPVPHGYVRCLF